MASIKSENWINKRVLVTGHTGFKGVWLTLLLRELGAKVLGMSLPVSEANRFYTDLSVSKMLEQEIFLDLSSTSNLQDLIDVMKPDFVFHLAAQALVLEGISNPVQTFSTNVMGTMHLLDATINSIHKVSGICVITTDKVYAEIDNDRSFRETDQLGGTDPYSTSKVAAEMAVNAMYAKFREQNVPISIARAGNVIGGGDWAKNRLLPDLVSSYEDHSPVTIRNPKATRPFQHVLDCLWGYVLLADKTRNHPDGDLMTYNFGPSSSLRVEEVVKMYESIFSLEAVPISGSPSNFERQSLQLDSSKAHMDLNWRAFYNPRDAVNEALVFYRSYLRGDDLNFLSEKSMQEWFQIHA